MTYIDQSSLRSFVNYISFLDLSAEARNKKLTCIHVEMAQLVGFVKRWSDVSQKSVPFDSGIT